MTTTTTTLNEPAARQSSLTRWPVFLLAAWAALVAMVELSALAVMELGGATSARAIRSIPIFHLSAEWLMAVLPAVGAVAWWRGHRWGPTLLLLGFGTWIYAVAHAASWAVVNEPVLLAVFSVSVLITVVFGGPLILRPDTAFGPRTRRRTIAMVVLVLFMLQIFGLWAMYFITGEMANVFSARTDNHLYLVRTLSGELPLVLAAAVGAWGWHRGSVWSPGLVLLAAGMMLYAGLNNFGLAVSHSAPRSAYCVATLLVALLLYPVAHRAFCDPTR